MFFKDEISDIRYNKGVLLLSAKMMNKSFNVEWKKTCWDANTCRVDEYVLWHKRLGHFNYASLRRMENLQIAYGLPNIQDEDVFL